MGRSPLFLVKCFTQVGSNQPKKRFHIAATIGPSRQANAGSHAEEVLAAAQAL
jgi:hypothetical protein